jgi:hypothetical protein
MSHAKPKSRNKGIDPALKKLRDNPAVPKETLALVEATIEAGVNTGVLAFSLNSASNTYLQNITGYRMEFSKASRILVASLENACVLHSPELGVSMQHIEAILVKLGMLRRCQSILEVEPDVRETAKKFIKTLMTWRDCGGRGSWKYDSKEIYTLVTENSEDIDRLTDGIRSSRSISGRLVGALDSVSTPLLQGAL